MFITTVDCLTKMVFSFLSIHESIYYKVDKNALEKFSGSSQQSLNKCDKTPKVIFTTVQHFEHSATDSVLLSTLHYLDFFLL